MNLSAIDWAIVLGYFALSMGIGLVFTKKGGESIEEYFLSGRNVSWWLAGASMVATTFAADTPLVVTGFVFALLVSIPLFATGQSWWGAGGDLRRDREERLIAAFADRLIVADVEKGIVAARAQRRLRGEEPGVFVQPHAHVVIAELQRVPQQQEEQRRGRLVV